MVAGSLRLRERLTVRIGATSPPAKRGLGDLMENIVAGGLCRAGSVRLRLGAPLPRHCVLVNVFFLRVVQAHQGLDRLDHALRVAHDVTIRIGGRDPRRGGR
jgi:hypothetical protein